MFFISHKHASRKYIDLINETSSKFANWDPPKPIKVGDLGIIKRDSGEFFCHGNVYEEEETKAIAAPFPPEKSAGEDVMFIKSHRAKRVDHSVAAQGSISGAANGQLNFEVQFDRERGAFLIMHRVRMATIPDKLLLALGDVSMIKNKQIVTQVFTCDGFALCLSSKSAHAVTISLQGDASPVGVPLPVTAGASLQWHLSGGSNDGIFRSSYCKADEPKFSPLYNVKSFRKRIFGRRDLPTDDPQYHKEQWLDVEVPWDELDEDGMESDEEAEDSEPYNHDEDD